MNQRQKNTITMLGDALATATHNPPASPPPDFSVILGQLTTVITQAQAAAVTQTADRGSSRTALHAARTALFTDHLRPIHDIAVGRLTSVANVRQLFRLPARGVHRATLIKDATIIANNATQYKDVLIASGLPADFVDQLNTAITAVAQTSATYVTTHGDQQKATQTLKAMLTQGEQLVNGLNGIMQLAFAKNPDVLAAWNSARHIRRVAASPGPIAATPTTSAPAATTNTGTTSLGASTGASGTAPAEAIPLLHAA